MRSPNVYEGTSCSDRHAAYRTHIDFDLTTAAAWIDSDLKSVQLDITYTKKPGLAAEALKMKNDLQALKEKLEQIRQSLH